MPPANAINTSRPRLNALLRRIPTPPTPYPHATTPLSFQMKLNLWLTSVILSTQG